MAKLGFDLCELNLWLLTLTFLSLVIISENFMMVQWWEYSQLECLHSEDPPLSWLPLLLSHIGSQVKRRQSQSYRFKEFAKFQMFEFLNKRYTWHTFWSCLIRCANLKWIQQVLLKIQSGHDSVHGWTDGRLWRIWSQLPWSKLHHMLASSFLSSSYRVICVGRWFFISMVYLTS